MYGMLAKAALQYGSAAASDIYQSRRTKEEKAQEEQLESERLRLAGGAGGMSAGERQRALAEANGIVMGQRRQAMAEMPAATGDGTSGMQQKQMGQINQASQQAMQQAASGVRGSDLQAGQVLRDQLRQDQAAVLEMQLRKKQERLDAWRNGARKEAGANAMATMGGTGASQQPSLKTGATKTGMAANPMGAA